MNSACTIADVSKAIQIRDVPDDIHRTLKARAAAAGMSLSEFLLGELSRVAARPPMADVLARSSERSGGVPQRDIVEAVRSARQRT
jgi:plasmid stability protein